MIAHCPALTRGTRILTWLAALLLVGGEPLRSGTAEAFPWNDPERVTHNTVEDRTTSGSLVYPCYGEAYAVWMQEQAAPGWRIVHSSRDIHGWREPAPIDPGIHPDYEPRIGLGSDLRAVWQRGVGSAAEIIYAEKPFSGDWVVEPITFNGSEDMAPDIPALAFAQHPEPHVAWAGLDPTTQEGKIFHAVRSGSGWEIERLDGSQLGPFWTGAAPRIFVGIDGIIHVVYRGGDFGDYHLHYARKQAGVWTYQVLASPNANDLSVDVAAPYSSLILVAMSGNDCFGCPARIYVRRSTDGGLTFGAAELVSGSFSASLENLVVGVTGPAIVGSEVSGNIYTGNMLYTLVGQAPPELLPPTDMASEAPCAGQILCIPDRHGPGDQSVLYVNHQNAGADSAEVYFLATPGFPEGIADGVAPPAVGAGLSLRTVPNPFSASIEIEILGADPFRAPAAASVYDISGRLVQRLAPARGGFLWDGSFADGRAAPAGIYWITVNAGGQSVSRAVVRAR